MHTTNVDERVKLCAARSLGLAENLNDAIVLIDALTNSGIVDIEIPEHSMMKSITGEDFVKMLTKAVIQFQEEGDWIDLTRDDVEQAGGATNVRNPNGGTIYYRVENEDGSLPDPPQLFAAGDRVVVFHR